MPGTGSRFELLSEDCATPDREVLGGAEKVAMAATMEVLEEKEEGGWMTVVRRPCRSGEEIIQDF